MIISTIVIVVAVLGIGAILFKDSLEESKRKNTFCNFNNRISKAEFKQIAETACNSINRIVSFSIDGPIIRGVVRSNSGISTWSFSLDFNDYGKISGQYWLTSKNNDSKIPEIVAELIKAEITKKL